MHGDVRAANVVAHGGTYVLVDWGHARLFPAPPSSSRPLGDKAREEPQIALTVRGTGVAQAPLVRTVEKLY